MDGDHPHRHRPRFVLALPPRCRARLRPAARCLLRTLVADVASPEEGNDKFPQSIGEPLFELPLSGWYWQVTRLDTPKPEVHSSRSLWDSNLPRLPEAADRAAAAERVSARLRAGLRGRAAAPRRAQHRSRRRGPLSDRGGGRCVRNRRGDAELRPRHRRDLCRAGRGAVVDHCLAGAFRPLPAQAHFGKPGRDPFRPDGA